MATPTIDLSEILKQLDENIERLKALKKNERIRCNALVEELKHNLRLCQMYFELNLPLEDLLPRMSRIVFDEVLATGFRLKSLKRRKIVREDGFERYHMASWIGKPTPKLLRNTYDKITELVEFFPVAHPVRINPRLRMKNLHEKILMLLATLDCD